MVTTSMSRTFCIVTQSTGCNKIHTWLCRTKQRNAENTAPQRHSARKIGAARIGDDGGDSSIRWPIERENNARVSYICNKNNNNTTKSSRGISLRVVRRLFFVFSPLRRHNTSSFSATTTTTTTTTLFDCLYISGGRRGGGGWGAWNPRERWLRVMAWEWEIGIVTCVCSRVRPRIHRICPARGFLSESGSNFSSPRLIAPISSGWPRPHLFLKNMKPILHHSIPVTHMVYNQSSRLFFFFRKKFWFWF